MLRYYGYRLAKGLRPFKQYLTDNGSFSVPKNYTADGLQLYSWITNQRTKYRTGKLASWKIDKLNSINFPWTPNLDRWQTAFKYAERYFIEHGDSDVLQDYVTSDGFALGSWCAEQRKQYKNGKLSKQKIDLLERLNFHWLLRETAWEQGYKEAIKYYDKYGCLDFSTTYVTVSGYRLGEWLRTQVRMFKKGTLTSER